VLLALALALGGCKKEPRADALPDLPAVPVRAQKVEAKPRTATEEIVGTVRAKLRAVVESKVSGRIEKMLVAPGQAVKAGDLLVQLDVREIQARLDQANALREQAERDLKRSSGLFQQGALAQAEYDSALARQRVAQASVSEAETMLGYAKITAPFDGVITRKLADVGDLANPGRPLLEIEDPRALRLEADVPEVLIGKLELGAKLRVRVAALERDLEGTVAEIAPAADPVSRTFSAKVDLPAGPGLRAGQFGRVSIPVGESAALRAPASALVQRGQMELVFVVSDHRAWLRLVKTGKRIGDEVELISGVEAGEQVVVEGAAGLMDGQPVEMR
jgi:RND family efflux transporter MFP subunit